MDQCSRKCLTLVADTSIGGMRIVHEQAVLVDRYAKPLGIFSENDAESTRGAVLIWA